MSARIGFTLAADGSASVTERDSVNDASYTVLEGRIEITADGDTLTFTITDGYLTIPNPTDESGLPVFYFSKQP